MVRGVYVWTSWDVLGVEVDGGHQIESGLAAISEAIRTDQRSAETTGNPHKAAEVW